MTTTGGRRERLTAYLRSPSPLSGQATWNVLLLGLVCLFWAVSRTIVAMKASGTWPLLWRWGLAAVLAAGAAILLGSEAQRWWRSRSR